MQFLSSETLALMGIKNVGEFKVYFVERFRGILNLTVNGADKTRSSLPSWAKQGIWEASNVSD